MRAPGLELTVVETGALKDLHVTVTPAGHEPLQSTVRRLAETLHAWDATAVRIIAFGSVHAAAATSAALRQSLDDPGLPMTWLEGGACDGGVLAGLQVQAVAGTRVQTLEINRQPLGRLWQDSRATHGHFSGLGGQGHSDPPQQQANSALSQLTDALDRAGMTFHHVVRTWFYLDDILAWYDAFNTARNGFFKTIGLQPGRVPASTGVSGRNPQRSAVSLAAWAVKPHDPGATVVHVVPSPRQCPAPAYGSAFSRAVEIQSPGYRQLLISGTASIEAGGRTVHEGDVDAQIECTMRVVQAILESRGMSLSHTTRATAYFRSALDVPRFAAWRERHNAGSLPVVQTCCDICRDDLLFELELDALAAD